jgi:hypothetical protein
MIFRAMQTYDDIVDLLEKEVASIVRQHPYPMLSYSWVRALNFMVA